MPLKKVIVVFSLLSLPFSVNSKEFERKLALTNGDLIEIDLLAPCADANFLCSTENIAIIKNPGEGVLISSADSIVRYQHGGTSLNQDHFSYYIQRLPDLELLTVNVVIDVQIANAKVTIVSPADGARISGGAVTVQYRITGTGYDHAHIQLNRQGHNSISKHSNRYTFTDVSPGTHEITISLSNAQHRTLSIPGSTDSIRIHVD